MHNRPMGPQMGSDRAPLAGDCEECEHVKVAVPKRVRLVVQDGRGHFREECIPSSECIDGKTYACRGKLAQLECVSTYHERVS